MTTSHRYRITVTPIEADGLPCNGRCTIEFEQHSAHHWMHALESTQRRLACTEAASVVVATGLLETLSTTARDERHLLAALQPELDGLLTKLRALRELQ